MDNAIGSDERIVFGTACLCLCLGFPVPTDWYCGSKSHQQLLYRPSKLKRACHVRKTSSLIKYTCVLYHPFKAGVSV